MDRSVAVVTPSVGRATLQQTIDSVQAQTYPCQHYIIFDGPVTQDTIFDIPDNVHVIHLPKPTGLNAIKNGAICAAAAFLVTEDYLCFCDDDNWYEPNHIANLMGVMGDAAYAYSLRRIVEPDGTFWQNDDGESLGHHGDLVDVNCYLLRRDIACGIAPLWCNSDGHNMVGDRVVWNALKTNNIKYAASGKYTVNYRLDPKRNLKNFFFLRNIQNKARFPDGLPWAA